MQNAPANLTLNQSCRLFRITGKFGEAEHDAILWNGNQPPLGGPGRTGVPAEGSAYILASDLTVNTGMSQKFELISDWRESAESFFGTAPFCLFCF